LELDPPDRERFPAIALGEECARAGGTAGAVLNAANEAAVQAFLDGDLHFTEIVPACRSVLAAHQFEPHPSLDTLLRLDRWAREEVGRWVCA
jgi:1-deoxy-D-xylulose-5-phosphate reductoisomerase